MSIYKNYPLNQAEESLNHNSRACVLANLYHADKSLLASVILGKIWVMVSSFLSLSLWGLGQ